MAVEVWKHGVPFRAKRLSIMGGKVNLYGQKSSRCFCTTLCMLLYSNVPVATIASNTHPYTIIAFSPQVVKPARKGTSVPSATPPYYTNMIFSFSLDSVLQR